MSPEIFSLVEAALDGDWSPLIEESKKAPGKYWAEDAQCCNKDVDLFVPPEDGLYEDPDAVKERIGPALNRPLNLCASCPAPVAARCLIESLRDDEHFGIRAGLLSAERRPLRTAWRNRVDEEEVQAALRGATLPIGRATRNAVIARFAEDPALDPAPVARALGVSHEYLLKLVRRHKKADRAAPPSSSSQPVRPA